MLSATSTSHPAGQRFVLNLGFVSMGHGTAAPIGAALAGTGRPIFAIVGDACFAMNGMELITAVESEVPVVWIVEHNNMQGITHHASKRLSRNGKPLRSSGYRRRLDVAGIARAFGLVAQVVERPGELQDAGEGCVDSAGPALIEVRGPEPRTASGDRSFIARRVHRKMSSGAPKGSPNDHAP
jgi:acetolactate synthase-1/2/3 large subunit